MAILSSGAIVGIVIAIIVVIGITVAIGIIIYRKHKIQNDGDVDLQMFGSSGKPPGSGNDELNNDELNNDELNTSINNKLHTSTNLFNGDNPNGNNPNGDNPNGDNPNGDNFTNSEDKKILKQLMDEVEEDSNEYNFTNSEDKKILKQLMDEVEEDSNNEIDNMIILLKYENGINLSKSEQLKILVNDDETNFTQIIYFIKTNTQSDLKSVIDILFKIPINKHEKFKHQFDIITDILNKITAKMNDGKNTSSTNICKNSIQNGLVLQYLIDKNVNEQGLNKESVTENIINERCISIGKLLYCISIYTNGNNNKEIILQQDDNIRHFIHSLIGNNINDIYNFLATISNKEIKNFVNILNYSYNGINDPLYSFRMLYILCNNNINEYISLISKICMNQIAQYITQFYSKDIIMITNMLSFLSMNELTIFLKEIFSLKYKHENKNENIVKCIGNEICSLMKKTITPDVSTDIKLAYFFSNVINNSNDIYRDIINILTNLSDYNNNRYKYIGQLLLSMNEFSVSFVTNFIRLICNNNVIKIVLFMYNISYYSQSISTIEKIPFMKFIQFIVRYNNNDINNDIDIKPTDEDLAFKYGNFLKILLVQNQKDVKSLTSRFNEFINIINNKTFASEELIIEWLAGPKVGASFKFIEKFIDGFTHNGNGIFNVTNISISIRELCNKRNPNHVKDTSNNIITKPKTKPTIFKPVINKK